MSLDAFMIDLQELLKKHDVGGSGHALVGGKFDLNSFPDMDKVKAAVEADYHREPEGFAHRALDQVAGFLTSDPKYSRAWTTTVLLVALDLLDNNKEEEEDAKLD